MAFPVVATKGTTHEDDAGNETNHVIDLPASIASGDLLMIFLGGDGTPTFTWPSGANDAFTEIAYGNIAAAAVAAVAYRIANGSEPASVTVVSSVTEKLVGFSWRITGWHGTTPPEDSAVASGNSANPNSASLSPSWGAEDTLWVSYFGMDGAPNALTLYPASYPDNRENAIAGGAGAGWGGICSRNLNAASDDPEAYTMDLADQWVAFTVAIRPAAGAPSDPYPAGYKPVIEHNVLLRM